MASAFKYIYKCIIEIETALVNNLLQRFSPGQLAPALAALPKIENTTPHPSLRDLLEESILWAVPKKRRSAEKVRCRKFGVPKYHWKPYVQKTNIIICRYCGGYQEAGRLCGTCYKKVMEETEEIKDKINEELGISPVEEEVIVLYENEIEEKDPEFWKGKRIIEMKKPRPSFFSKNLLQTSTQPNADTKEVAEVRHRLEYE